MSFCGSSGLRHGWKDSHAGSSEDVVGMLWVPFRADQHGGLRLRAVDEGTSRAGGARGHVSRLDG